MPAQSRKTPDRIARMMALHREGKSAREIAEGLGISHGAVTQWLKDSGLVPNGGQGPRNGRARKEPNGAGQIIAATEQALAELKAGPLPTDRAGAVEYLRVRLGQVSALAQQFGALARSGSTGMADFVGAVKLEQSLAAQIAELSPREVHDPQTDPANVEAATDVRRRLEGLVEAAERNFKCACCGGDPYGRVDSNVG